MQSRAQRRQYGEPVRRLPLSIRYGQRHTREIEAEFESIKCSPLHIRIPRVHVPPLFSQQSHESRIRNGVPIKPLQRTIPPQGHWCNINEPIVQRARR